MQNFGKIKQAFNDILAESIIDKSAEKRKIVKRYIKTISESKILKTQFLVYNNIENKVDENQFSANLYITENIKLLKKFSKNDIISENKRLIKMSQMVSKRLDVDYDKKPLHEAISNLIFSEPTARNIQTITESRMSVIKYINENKAKIINESPVLPTSLLANMAVDRFNEKYADLSEEEHRVLNVILDTNNDKGRKEVFVGQIRECINLVNEKLKNTTNKEKLLDVKDKLLRSEYVDETFSTDIMKILDLKKTLTSN